MEKQGWRGVKLTRKRGDVTGLSALTTADGAKDNIAMVVALAPDNGSPCCVALTEQRHQSAS
jgi:hypothetical protein